MTLGSDPRLGVHTMVHNFTHNFPSLFVRAQGTPFHEALDQFFGAGSEEKSGRLRKKSEPTKKFFRAGQKFSPSRTNIFIRADNVFYLGRPKYFESGVRRASDGQLHVPAIGPWHLNSFVFPMEIVIRVPGFAPL